MTPTRRIKLKQALDMDRTEVGGAPVYKYQVRTVVNATDPVIGAWLTRESVDLLIAAGFIIEITA